MRFHGPFGEDGTSRAVWRYVASIHHREFWVRHWQWKGKQILLMERLGVPVADFKFLHRLEAGKETCSAAALRCEACPMRAPALAF